MDIVGTIDGLRGIAQDVRTTEDTATFLCEAADLIASLRSERDALKETVGHLNGVVAGRCVCKFDLDGNPVRQCMDHLEVRAERDALREALSTDRMTAWSNTLDQIADGVERTNKMRADKIRYIASAISFDATRLATLLSPRKEE